MTLKSINILGKRYKIKKLTSNFDENYLGVCQDDIATIYLNTKLREGEEYWTTLFHEVGHGVMYRNGIRFSGAIPLELEEIIVETMSQAYYVMFKAILKDIKNGKDNIFSDEVDSFCKDTK